MEGQDPIALTVASALLTGIAVIVICVLNNYLLLCSGEAVGINP